jgi:hypothetical protein
MKKNTAALIATIAFIFFAMGIASVWFLSSSKKTEDINYLMLIIGLNTIMTTFAIGFASFKVISSKDSKDMITEILDNKSKNFKEKFDEAAKLLNQQSEYVLKSLISSSEVLTAIVQERAVAVKNDMKWHQAKLEMKSLLQYIDEMDKEAFAILHMCFLVASPDPDDRLKGYQLLDTIRSDEVVNFFRKKLIYEKSKENRKYLMDSIK